jgi:hypothetical protein
MVPLDHVHELSIFEEGNGRRRGRIREQKLAGFFGSLRVHTGKYSHQPVWLYFTLEGCDHPGAAASGCTATYRVDYQQGSTF